MCLKGVELDSYPLIKLSISFYKGRDESFFPKACKMVQKQLKVFSVPWALLLFEGMKNMRERKKREPSLIPYSSGMFRTGIYGKNQETLVDLIN